MSAGVTVVIPTRNRLGLLARTLSSVLAQEGVDLDVVVVDDGGSDGTSHYVAAHPDPRVRGLRHETSLGVSAARNTGCAAARGEWLAFLDDDDLWAPDKLRSQLDRLQQEPDALFCCVSAVKFDVQGALGGQQRVPTGPCLLPALLRGNTVPGGASGVLASRVLFEQVGPFDTRLSNFADWDMWLRLASAAPACAVDRPLVAYRVHAGSMSHDVSGARVELQVLSAKHADLARGHRERIGGPALEHYLATQHMRAGRPVQALATYAPLVLRGRYRPRTVVGMLRTAARPSRQARHDARAATRLPEGWAAEVESWLRPLLDHAHVDIPGQRVQPRSPSKYSP